MCVGHAYEQFTRSLPGFEPPLNFMRKMKEENLNKLRTITRDPSKFGDPVLAMMCENCEELGISRNSWNMVYEAFWDLYCKKPATPDLTAKKLDTWYNTVRMSVPTWPAPEPTAEPDQD